MLTDENAHRIAAETGLDPRTVRSCFDGKGRRATVRAVINACTKLGIPSPETTEKKEPTR